MNRKKNFKYIVILPDYKYNSVLVSRVINNFMKNGRKSLACHIVYRALSMITEKYNREGHTVLAECIKKISPNVYLRSKRIASKIYRIPVTISDRLACSIAIKWLKSSLKTRKEKGQYNRLFYEMCDILNDKGESIKKRDNYHKVAKDNEAFIHYG